MLLVSMAEAGFELGGVVSTLDCTVTCKLYSLKGRALVWHIPQGPDLTGTRGLD